MKRFAFFLILFSFSLFAGTEKKFPLVTERPLFDLFPNAIQVHNGRIYVSDRADYSIKVFSESGKYLFKFGEKGEGPGLFKRWFGAYTISPDGKIYQADFWGGNRFINVFSKDGKFLKTIPINFKGNFGVADIMADKSGRIILGLISGYNFNRKEGIVFTGSYYNYYLLARDGNLKKIHTDLIYHSFSFAENGPQFTLPLEVYYISAYSPEINTLALCKNNEARIMLINLTTGMSKVIDTGWKKEMTTKPELAELIKPWTETSWMQPEGKELYKKLSPSILPTPYKPIIKRILFTPEEDIIAIKSLGRNIYQIKKFSLSGKLIGEFTDTNYPRFITKNRAYFTEENEKEHRTYMIIKERGKY